MRTSLMAAAGVAVAAATVLALAGTAHATPAPAATPTATTTATAREHTTLSIVESKSVIKLGKTAIVGGTLDHDATGLGAETVYLEHWAGGTLVDVRTGTTNAAGWVAFTVEPGVTSRYELIFNGTSTLARSHSGIVTLKVIAPAPVREHTTLSIVESKSVIKDGKTAIVGGTLDHDATGLAGETVYLEHWVGKRLVGVRTGTTNAAGWVAFTVKPGATSRYELVFRGTSTLAPSHSGVVTLKVVA